MSDVSEPAVVCFLSNVWTVWSFQYIIHCTVIVAPGGREVSDWRQTVFLSGPSVPDGGGGFALLPSLRGPANLATQSGLENIPSVKEVWRASLTAQTPKKVNYEVKSGDKWAEGVWSKEPGRRIGGQDVCRHGRRCEELFNVNGKLLERSRCVAGSRLALARKAVKLVFVPAGTNQCELVNLSLTRSRGHLFI